jgi:hypothetical protein
LKLSSFQTSDKHIIKCLIDVFLFIEFSTQEIIDEDAGVSLMEQIVYELGLMDSHSKIELSHIITKLASEYSADKQDFIKSLPDSIGLSE